MSMKSTTIAGRAATDTIWTIDCAHSRIQFSVRHMMIATVNGAFQHVDGTIRWDGEHLESAAVEARIDARSITTHNQQRDDHLRSGDFLLVEQWPTITFTSTRVEPTGRGRFTISGDLTIRGRTQPVVIAVDAPRQITDGEGRQRADFTGTTSLSRKDFGITWNQRLDGGGVVIGDTVKVALHILAVHQR